MSTPQLEGVKNTRVIRDILSVLSLLPTLLRVSGSVILFAQLLLAAIQLRSVMAMKPVLDIVSSANYSENNLFRSILSFLCWLTLANISSIIVRHASLRYSAVVGRELVSVALTQITSASSPIFGTLKSSEISELLDAASEFSSRIFRPFLTIFEKLFTVAALAIGIYNANPSIAVSLLCIVCLIYIWLHHISSKKASVVSRKLRSTRSTVLDMQLNLKDSVFERLIFGDPIAFSRRYLDADYQHRLEANRLVEAAEAPKDLIEIIVISSFMMSAAVSLIRSGPSSIQTLPILLYGFQKLLPAAQTLFRSFYQLRGRYFSIQILTQLYTYRQNINDLSEMKNENIVAGIPLSYIQACELNLGESRGLIGLKGPSGSGKSTYFKSIVARTLVAGEEHRYYNIDEQRRLFDGPRYSPGDISYIPHHPYIFEGTVCQNVVWHETAPYPVLGNADNERLMMLSSLFGLNWVNGCENDTLNQSISFGGSELSQGQKNTLFLVRAMFKSDAKLILLDETLTGLDHIRLTNALEILRSLAEKKRIMVITHDSNVLKKCDEIVVFPFK